MVDVNDVLANLEDDQPQNSSNIFDVDSVLANLDDSPIEPQQETINPAIQDRLSSAMAAVDIPDGFGVNASEPELSYPSLEEVATELVTPPDQRQYQSPDDMIEQVRPTWEYSEPIKTAFKPEQLERLAPLSQQAKENTGGDLQRAIARLSDNSLYDKLTTSSSGPSSVFTPYTIGMSAPPRRRPLNEKERGERMAQDIKLVQEYLDKPRQYSDMVTQGFTPEQIQQWELAGEIGAGEGIDKMSGRDWLEKVPLAGMVFSLKHSAELMSAVDRLSDPNKYDKMTVNSGQHEYTGYNPYFAGGRMSVPVKRNMTEDEQIAQMEKDIDLITEYLEKRAELEVRGTTLGNDVLQGILEMPDFLATFMASGPAGAVVKKGVGKAILNTAVKKLGKKAVIKLLKKKGVMAGLKVAGSMLDAGGRMVVQTPEIVANAIQNNTDSGEYNLTEHGLDILKDRENMSKSLTRAIGDMYIENFSELSGSGLSKVGGKIAGKIGDFVKYHDLPGGKTGRKFLKKLEEFYKSKNPDGDFGKLMRDKMKFGGFIEEYSEEVWGDFLRGVFDVNDFGAGEDAGMGGRLAGYAQQQTDMRNILTTAGVLAAPGGFRHTVSLLENRHKNTLDDKAVDKSLERHGKLSGNNYQGQSDTESDYQIYENAVHQNNARKTRQNNTERIMAPLKKRIEMRDMGMGLKKGTITTRSKKTALGVAEMYNSAYNDVDATIRQTNGGRWLVTVRQSKKIDRTEGRGISDHIDTTGELIPFDLQLEDYSDENNTINPERGVKQIEAGRSGQDVINSSQPDSQVADNTSANVGAEGQFDNQHSDTDSGSFDNQQAQTASIDDDVEIVKYPGLDKEDIPLEDRFIMSSDTADWEMLGDLGLELEDVIEGADPKMVNRAEAIFMQPRKKQPPAPDTTIFQAESDIDGKALEGESQVVDNLPESFESYNFQLPKPNHIGDTELTDKQMTGLQERVNKQKKPMWARLDKAGRPYLTSKRPKKEPFLELQPQKPGKKKSAQVKSASPKAAIQQQATEDYMNRLANEVHTGNITHEQAERSAKIWGKANIDGEGSGLEALEQAVERASESEETDPVATEIKDIEDKLWQFDMQDRQTEAQREIIRELNDRLRELKQQQKGDNDDEAGGSPAKLPDKPDNSGDGVVDQKQKPKPVDTNNSKKASAKKKKSAKKVKAEEKQEPENNAHIKYDPKLHRLTGNIREDDYYGDYAEAEVVAGPDKGKTVEIPVSMYDKEIKTVNTMLERLRQNTVNVADGQIEDIIEQAKKQGRKLDVRDVTPYVPGVSLRHIEDGSVDTDILPAAYENLKKTFAAFNKLDEFEKIGIKPYTPTTANGWQITDIEVGDKVRISGSKTYKTVKKVDHGHDTIVVGNDNTMGIDGIVDVKGKKPSGKRLSDKYPDYNESLNDGDIYVHSRYGKPGYYFRGDTPHQINDRWHKTEAEVIEAQRKYLKDKGIEQPDIDKQDPMDAVSQEEPFFEDDKPGAEYYTTYPNSSYKKIDEPEYLPKAKADKKVTEWKKQARKDGENRSNYEKTILSLFDRTGQWSKPWRDAGYNVVQIDLADLEGFGWQMDIRDIDPQWLFDSGLLDGETVHGILAAPPCVDFAVSGARWFNEKDKDGRTEVSIDLVDQVHRIVDFVQPDWWVLENPVGRLPRMVEGVPEKPQIYFQPWFYGDPYTKKTGLWGDFNWELPQAPVEPTEGSKIYKLRGDVEEEKLARSITPEGFAYAFYMANRNNMSFWEKVDQWGEPEEWPDEVHRNWMVRPEGMKSRYERKTEDAFQEETKEKELDSPVKESQTEYGYGTFDSELSDDHTGGYYKYQPGQTMKTASGRMTKPVPKIDTSTRQKAKNSQKRINTWLLSEAVLEAKNRDDSLNERIYANEEPKKIPPATLDMIQDYIFNPENANQSGKADIFKDSKRKPQERTEPWQFTKAEYMKHITVKGDKIYFMGKELTDMMRKALKKDAENLHRHLVRDAVEDGYTLPPDVAREYDDYANLEQYRYVDQMSYEDIMAEKKEVRHKIDNYGNVITADQRRELEGLKQRFAVLATERGKRERGNDNKQTGLDLGYESGKVMKTRMGRTTKPVPSDITQIEQWLISEAELEAKKRGDDLNIDYWQKKYANGLPADKIKEIQDYLFHDISESPEVSQHNYGEGRSASQEVIFKGGAIRWEEDRIRVYFDDKPSAEIRKQLKGRGFALKWSPKNKAWQTHFMQQHRYDRIVTYLDTILDRVEVSVPETEASEIVPQEENGGKTSDRPLKGIWYDTRDGIFPGQLVRNITNDNHLMIVDGEIGDSQVTVRPIDGTEMNEYPIQVDKLEPLYDNIADKAYNDKAAAAYKQLIGFDDAKAELGQHWVELKGVTKLDNPRFVQDLIGVTMATNRGDTVWAYSTSQEPQVSAYLKRRDAVEGAFKELVRMYKEDSTETVIPVQSMTRQQLENELTESEKRIRELETEEETPANLREYQTLETRIRSIDSEISEQIQDGRSIPKLENRPETIALIDDLLTKDFAEIELANGWKISSIGKIDGTDRYRLKGPEFKHEKMLKRMKITTRPIHGMDMFLLPSGESALRKKVQELIAKYKLPGSDKSKQDKPVVKDNLITGRAEYKDIIVGTFFKLNDRYGNTVGPVRQSDGSVEVEYHGYKNITAFISSDDITPLFDPTTNDAVLASYMNLISHQKASLGGIDVRIEESDTSKGAYRAVGTKNGKETRISKFSNPADKEGIEPTVLKGYHWLVKEYAEGRQKKPEAATGTIDVSKANTDDLRKFMFDAGLSEESQRESGIEHTLSDEAAKKFKEKAKKLADLVNKRMNSNPMVDPEIWGAVVDLTVTGLELGIYKFGDMVRHLKNEVGDKVTHFVARNLEKAWDKLAMSDTSGLVQKRDGETVDKILENQKPQSKPEQTEFKIEKGNLESFVGSLYSRFDNILESDNDFPASAFFKMADQYFGGSRADGVYGPSEAYDVLEVAINRYILDKGLVDKLPAGQSSDIASEQVDKLGGIVKKLMVSQTNRSGEKATMQQFSTPPHYAAAAGWVANISENDRVLEPSAGTGCLCLVPITANATVQANELSDRRGELLQQLSDNIEVTGENAEYIQHLVSEDNRPDVVLMNPPFSRSAAKAGGKKKALGTDIKHIEAALDTLKPGGRLVAIMGAGLHGPSASFTRWMLKIKGIYSVRANVTLDRSVYKKYGTEFPTRMLVIDKVNPTGHNIVSGEYATPSEMMMALDEVRNDRVETTEPTATVATGKQTGRKSDATPASKSSGTSGMATGSRRSSSDKSGRVVSKPKLSSSTDSRERSDAGPTNADGTVSGLRGDAGEFSGDQSTSGREDSAGNDADISESNRRKSSQSTTGKSSGQSDGVVSGVAGTQITDSVFEPYIPVEIFPGAKDHPATLVESAAMAAVPSPAITYTPEISKNVINDGGLSAAQIEAVARAGQAHKNLLPNGDRMGFMVGDGTGVGKGREISGIIVDNWNRGRKKAIWISKNKKLYQDAVRDLTDLGFNSELIHNLLKIKYNQDISEQIGDGVLFTTYNTVKSSSKNNPEHTRLGQIQQWIGEPETFDGVIALDEAHIANNVLGKGIGGPSKVAETIRELQELMPNARIVYVSATGASEVESLAYMERLGMWGKDTQFADVHDFINNIASGGVAAMEVVAQELKARGLYMARSIAYNDGTEDGTVQYDRLEHELDGRQKIIYDEIAKAWQMVLTDIWKSMGDTGAVRNSNARAFVSGQFWSANQRFFNTLITSMQIPSVIRSIESDMKEGRSAVLQITQTGQAAQERALARMEEGQDLEDFDSSPIHVLTDLVMNIYPVHLYEDIEDENGKVRSEQVKDSNGDPVVDQKALARRDALMGRLASIRVPASPLETIIDHFGVDNVAEVTGRTERVVYVEDDNGQMVRTVQRRPASANEAETAAFQTGQKRILIFSEAGGTGASYHADRRAENQQKRHHYLVDAGWKADAAMQGLGRCHRSNQVAAPWITLASTNLSGHKRFISTIARRLSQLGALTRGQAKASGNELFSANDNLESPEAKQAVIQLCTDIARGGIDDISGNEFLEKTGLKFIDEMGSLNESNIPESTQFLNRLLSLEFDYQNMVFSHFAERLEEKIQQAIANGTLDTGVENIIADRIEKVQQAVLEKYDDGGQTGYVQFTSYSRNEPKHLDEILRSERIVKWVRLANDKVVGLSEAGNVTNASGQVVKRYRIITPISRSQIEPVSEIDGNPDIVEVDKSKLNALWAEEVANTPEFKEESVHMVTGRLLPIWKQLKGQPQIRRLIDDKNEIYLGRKIPQKHAKVLLESVNITMKARKMPVKDIVDGLKSGGKLKLANGWTIRQRMTGKEKRYLLDGPDFTYDSTLNEMGIFSETVGYKQMYFIPAKDIGKTAQELIKQYKLEEFEGVENFQKPQAVEYLHESADLSYVNTYLENSELSPKRLGKAFGIPQKSISTTDTDGEFIVNLPNGKTVYIDSLATIYKDDRDDYRGLWRNLPGAITLEDGREIDFDGMIQLSAYFATADTLSHEQFHAAMDLALSDRERAVILSRFGGDEEFAAEIYGNWAAGRDSKGYPFFTKIRDFFRRIFCAITGRNDIGDIFSRIYSGKIWNESAQTTSTWREAPQKAKGRDLKSMIVKGPGHVTNRKVKQLGATWGKEHKTTPQERIQIRTDARRDYEGKKSARQLTKENAKTAMDKANFGINFITNILEPNRAATKSFGYDTVAEIIKMAASPEAGQLEFGDTMLSNIEMSYRELRDKIEKLSPEQKQYIYHIRGEAVSDAGQYLQAIAKDKISPEALEYAKMLDEVYNSAYDLLEKHNFEAMYFEDYFYGVYKNSHKGREITNKFLKHYPTTQKMLKHKCIPTVADASGLGLEMRDQNPVNNAFREVGAIWRLAAMVQLRDYLVKSHTETGIIHVTDANEYHLQNWRHLYKQQGSNVEEPIFQNYLLHPDLYRPIAALNSFNLTGRDGIRQVRSFIHIMNGFKFLLPTHHLRTIGAQAIVDSGSTLGMFKPSTWKKLTKYKIDDEMRKSKEYREYVSLGGGHNSSLEIESRQAMKKWLDEELRWHNAIVKIPMRMADATTGRFTNWTFEKYIPAVKYTKYLQEVDTLREKQGYEPTDAQKIEIIKVGQNFYGEMNEKIFGRSATVTSAMRFVFLAPGFREGNYRTMLRAADAATLNKLGGPLGRDWRSFRNIPLFLTLSMLAAQMASLILTGEGPEPPEEGENPEEWLRDLFKIRTGQTDNKGRPIMLDLMTTDKDYYEQIVSPFIKAITGRPIEGAQKAIYTVTHTIGGMSSPFRGMMNDLDTIAQGKVLVDWKGQRVWYESDSGLSKLNKFLMHEWHNFEPIPFSAASQMEDKGLGAMERLLATALAMRVSHSDLEKRRSSLWRKFFDMRDKRTELRKMAKENDLPQGEIDKFNNLLNDAMKVKAVPDDLREYMEELYLPDLPELLSDIGDYELGLLKKKVRAMYLAGKMSRASKLIREYNRKHPGKTTSLGQLLRKKSA